MITYNPKDWFTLIVQFHKSDTFRKLLPSIFSIGVYAAIVVYVEIHHLKFAFKNPTVMHSILGFVLSMLLVFRTNSAYDRWWEGRKIWGSFVNNSRNLTLKLAAFIPDEFAKERLEIKTQIINYVFAAKNHLRGKYVQSEFEPTDSLNLSDFSEADHRPNKVALTMYQQLNILYKEKAISGEQLIVLNEEVKSFTDNVGACERIKNTPIPYSYNIFLKKMIFLYIITLPIFFGNEYGYTTITIAMIVLYVFASIELIAEEIEDPFGEDDNDLPTDDICARIKANLNEIIK